MQGILIRDVFAGTNLEHQASDRFTFNRVCLDNTGYILGVLVVYAMGYVAVSYVFRRYLTSKIYRQYGIPVTMTSGRRMRFIIDQEKLKKGQKVSKVIEKKLFLYSMVHTFARYFGAGVVALIYSSFMGCLRY